MYNKFNISEIILNILAQNPEKIYSFEDLTSMLIPYLDQSLQESLLIQRSNQAKVLDALIMLDSEGLIILDSATDTSIITIKGLINISSKSFLN
ncbi:hypothetical protein BC749_11322 [Flavobacterium araucananum]|uniref:Uncharacterized protein n=1 Tax=Flavobacterium araucananum TaxID=946678 RepID=A0A227NKG2_9FLAO|nr:hypothetical protein [Flavobacterium araucananum]OXE98202.1 hypothetical protein B0A64_22595 [Flavobacterium araucananum]PWJ95551.1 hypothetical protein BC749_11322 [Flavobacterium araucananum]